MVHGLALRESRNEQTVPSGHDPAEPYTVYIVGMERPRAEAVVVYLGHGESGASAAILGPPRKLVAASVTSVDFKDAGHWLMEERPEETMDALLAFL